MSLINEAIRRIVKSELPVVIRVGKVKSFDADQMVCDVEIVDAPEMLDVRIRAVIDKQKSGILIAPTKGSFILVGLIENKVESAFVVGYSSIDSLKLLIGDIELNGDQYGGLCKVPELVKQLNKHKAILDVILNVLRTPVVEAAVGAPDTFHAALKLAMAGKQTGNFNDLENKNVKHG